VDEGHEDDGGMEEEKEAESRQHTSAYGSIRQHTAAYGSKDDGGMEEKEEEEEEEEEALAAVGVEWRGLGVLSPVPERCFLRRV
jgi:hypothetical protein